jgi:hypothetical protein
MNINTKFPKMPRLRLMELQVEALQPPATLRDHAAPSRPSMRPSTPPCGVAERVHGIVSVADHGSTVVSYRIIVSRIVKNCLPLPHPHQCVC